MSAPVRYLADTDHVREISLIGTADLGFWKRRLAQERLIPAERDGKAEIMIVAGTMTN
jgi:hypothetical protein